MKTYHPLLLFALSHTVSLLLYSQSFYGITYNGGDNGTGTLFRWNTATQHLEKKHDFSTISGERPSSTPVWYNQTLYGVTYQGGLYSGGVIYEYHPRTGLYTKRYDFSPVTGSAPLNCFTLFRGKFYGITSRGGSFDNGTIFEWDPQTNALVKKYDLHPLEGASAQSGLVPFGDKLVGTMSGGGTYNQGVIFEWDPTTNIFTKKVDFNGTLGARPYAQLTLLNNKFYGTTQLGGTLNEGVLFAWDPLTNLYTKKVDFAYNTGYHPYSRLTIREGKLYGLCAGGGAYGAGTLFQWDPVTEQYNVLHHLEFFTGAFPQFNDMVASGDQLLGLTFGGGATGAGAVFQWDETTLTFTKKADFGRTPTDGSNPIGSLLPEEAMTTLPLTVFRAKAVPGKAHVALTWEVTGTTPASVFIIERSYDNTRFTPVRRLTREPFKEQYQLIDSTAFATGAAYVYYRLAEVSPDGQHLYSSTRRVHSTRQKNDWRLSTPLSPHCLLTARVEHGGIFTLTLYNEGGYRLLRRLVELPKGISTFSFPTQASLARGLYFLEVSGPGYYQTMRLFHD